MIHKSHMYLVKYSMQYGVSDLQYLTYVPNTKKNCIYNYANKYTDGLF